MSCQILNSRTFCLNCYDIPSYYVIMFINGLVREHHNIKMPILGVKAAMSAMSNPSVLSTFWLVNPVLHMNMGKVI